GQQIPLAMPPPPTPPGAAAVSPDSSQPSGRRAGRKTQGRLGELSYPAGVPPGAAVPPAGPAAVPQPAQRHVIPPAAQEIANDIVEGMRHSSDLNVILQLAIEKLTTVGQAHRGLIWQVVGDQMTATNEFSVSGNTPFAGTQLGSEESTAIMLEFLSRFPDESGVGAISIPDTHQDTGVHKISH